MLPRIPGKRRWGILLLCLAMGLLCGSLMLQAKPPGNGGGGQKSFRSDAGNFSANPQELVATSDTGSVTVLVQPNEVVDFNLPYTSIPFTASAVWTDQVTGAVMTCSALIDRRAGSIKFRVNDLNCWIVRTQG